MSLPSFLSLMLNPEVIKLAIEIYRRSPLFQSHKVFK